MCVLCCRYFFLTYIFLFIILSLTNALGFCMFGHSRPPPVNPYYVPVVFKCGSDWVSFHHEWDTVCLAIREKVIPVIYVCIDHLYTATIVLFFSPRIHRHIRTQSVYVFFVLIISMCTRQTCIRSPSLYVPSPFLSDLTTRRCYRYTLILAHRAIVGY
jgi:hypothetical protein